MCRGERDRRQDIDGGGNRHEETVTIKAKDSEGKSLTEGGDAISVKCATSNNGPVTAVADHGNGSYTLSIECSSEGNYELEISINGEKMSSKLQITSVAYTPGFDPVEHHCAITLSEDRRKASVNGRAGVWCSVLGNCPMSQGQHTWKVKTSHDRSGSYCFMLGVAPKISPSSHQSDHSTVAYCWNINNNPYSRDGVQCYTTITGSNNGTFEFHLDCDQGTLQVRNIRTEKISTMTNLPQREYFQYVSMYDYNNGTHMVEYVEFD